MKNKITAFILSVMMTVLYIGQYTTFAQTNTVGEIEKLLDDIVVFNLKQNNAETVSEWLAKGAGGATESYAIALAQTDKSIDLSPYINSLEEYLATHSVKNAVTHQKYALALIAAGKPDSVYIRNISDSTTDTMGIMSIVYGLFLLNNKAVSQKFTPAGLTEKLLSMQFEDGGWALSGQYSDVDVTAMVLQSIAPYQSDGTVSESIERAVSFLSRKQLDSGGFSSYGNENPESSAQVIIALTSLGIDATSFCGKDLVAGFNQISYLKKQGENLWVDTAISGKAYIAEGNERPALLQEYVETSNVNVVNEMVQMIEVNRAYEANQKTIQTEDTMMSTLWSKVALLR